MARKAATGRNGRHPARTTTAEHIFGGKVASHGFTDLPNVLLCAQKRLGISPTQFNIITQLLSHWDDPMDPPSPPKRELAQRMGINLQTLRTNIADLEERGFVRREQRGAEGSGRGRGPNRYHLDGPVGRLKKLESYPEAEPN